MIPSIVTVNRQACMTSYIASMLHYILCRLPMWVPVSLAHQEETLVCYPIANHRLECLLGRVRIEDITVVTFTDNQLGPPDRR